MTTNPSGTAMCAISPDDPRHGTYAGTIAHWKAGTTTCPPCALAGRRMRKRNQLAILAGAPSTVELGDDAIRIIRETPRNQLVIKTGMTHERLWRYDCAGPTKRVHRTTLDRILNAAASPAWTPIGIQRRLQALGALGWSAQALSARSGIGATSLNCLRRRTHLKHVRTNFASRVIALYDDMLMTVPPLGVSATRTRNEATRNGYLPPLAWDDIDDPNERPRMTVTHRGRDEVDRVVIERALAGDFAAHATVAERVEIVRRWEARGLSLAELERMTGWATHRYTEREDVA